MPSSSCKSDEYLLPKYCQDGSYCKVGYFMAAQVKIGYDELFEDFLETYKHTIPSEVHVKRVKGRSNHKSCTEVAKARKRAIKFHLTTSQ